MKSCHLAQTTTKIRHGTIFRAEFNPVAGFSILFTNGIISFFFQDSRGTQEFHKYIL